MFSLPAWQNHRMSDMAISEFMVVIGAALFGSTISGFIGMGGGILLLTVLSLVGPPHVVVRDACPYYGLRGSSHDTFLQH